MGELVRTVVAGATGYAGRELIRLISSHRGMKLIGAFASRGRYRDSIAAHLELLADLGVIARTDSPEAPRWHRPQALGA